MRISIRWKWLFAFLLLGGTVLAFIMFYLGHQFEKYFESRFENRWRQELALARKYLQEKNFASLTIPETDNWADEIGTILGMRVTVIDLDGKVLGDSEVSLADLPEVENHRVRPEVLEALANGFGKSKRFSTTVSLDLVYLARPIGDIQNPLGIIRVAVPVSEIEGALSEIHQLIWFVSGLGFILTVFIGFFVSNRLTLRLNEMAAAAKRFAKGNFSRAVKINSDDELGDLGSALNQMAQDLQKYVAQITQERDQLQAILNSMVEGVMVTDLSGRIVLSNHSFQEIFKFSEPVQYKSIKEVFRDSQLLEAIEMAMAQKKDGSEAIELVSPFRKSLEAHIAIMGTKDKQLGIVVVFHDITQLKHLEKVRRDFVANVSHELRTPLTAIKGYAETILENSALPQNKAHEFLQTILRHTNRMSELIGDLLTLSKLESIDSEVHLQKIHVSRIIPKVVDNFKRIMAKKKVKLNLQIPDNLPGVKGIISEIETALENLLDNAFKYGAKGKEISVSAKELNSEIQVEVADKGIGIPADQQPRIFERFYRVAKGRSRVMGGTGLGLAIVKHIIQRHHGRIWVESEVGKGTTFSFTLPKENKR